MTDGPERAGVGVEESREARTTLQAAGLRATSARIAVLAMLRRGGRPLSHADAVALLGEEAWDKTTIYRNLVDLAEAGLVRRTELGDRTWRFEAIDAPEGEHGEGHPHFLCTECGAVECLELDQLPSIRGGGPRSLQRGEVEVQIRGLCDDCGAGGEA